MTMRFSFFLPLLFLAGCAGQRLPEGGPADNTPPEIVSVVPQPGTVLFTGSSVIVEFSEYVERRSAEEAVFISPPIEEKEFEWSGRELEIQFLEPLRPATTYVITIGTDVADLRAGNRMARSFPLSFSTGATIDNGVLQGKVYDEKPDGVMIFGYRLDSLMADTLNPARTKPDYVSQTGKSGEFSLQNVAPGTYRLFAVRDEYKDFLYQPETDAAGTVPDMTLSAKESLHTNINFTLAKEDTTPPRLARVTSWDAYHLTALFTEAVDSATLVPSAFIVTDTLGNRPVPVTALYAADDVAKSFMLITAAQPESARMMLTIKGIKDHAGLSVNPLANAMQFTSASVKDTMPPFYVSAPAADGGVKVFPGDSVELRFSDALRWPVADSALTVTRVKDSSIVPVKRSLRTPVMVALAPRSPWRAGDQYLIKIRQGAFADLFGNTAKDTTMSVRFAVEDPESYGSIDGKFAGYGNAAVVQAENISDKRQVPGRMKVGSMGTFSFQRLPEGKYVVKAFEDGNGNLRQDAGTVFPFVKSERFTFYKDTIRVRARWPVDGVIFSAP